MKQRKKLRLPGLKSEANVKCYLGNYGVLSLYLENLIYMNINNKKFKSIYRLNVH